MTQKYKILVIFGAAANSH